MTKAPSFTITVSTAGRITYVTLSEDHRKTRQLTVKGSVTSYKKLKELITQLLEEDTA